MKNKLFIAVLCLLTLPLCGLAQSYLLQGPPPEKGRLTLRYFWPQKGSGNSSGPDFLSGLYDLSVRFGVSDRIQVMAAVPYMSCKTSYLNQDWEKVTESFHGLGNISIALEILLAKETGRHTGLTIGAYLPTLTHKSSDDWEEHDAYANLGSIGWWADYAEFPKVLDATTLFLRAAHYQDLKGGFQVGLEAGGFIITKRNWDNTPLFLHYGVTAAKSAGPVSLKAEWRGSSQVAGFVDESYVHVYHQAALGIEWGKGRLRPGLFYTLFIDRENRERSNGALGFRLQFEW